VKVVLIAMPWHGLETGSLPLGILKSYAAQFAPEHEVVDYYANLVWADLLLTDSGGQITPDDYAYVANVGVWHSVGEWVFAGALYDDPLWRLAEYRQYLHDRDVDGGKSLAMRRYADGFIDDTVGHVLRLAPDLVGFTTTFSQNAASLAVAKRLKRERHTLPIVFGGGNCEGPMGQAISANFPFVDYVVGGEGEKPFIALLDAISAAAGIADVPGLIWRDESGDPQVNPPPPMMAMTQVPRPDYTTWQQSLRQSRVGSRISPQLTLEAARGCWWGEKHHCTFCGLNGTSMAFRAKPAEQFLADLQDMVAKHQILDVVMVDNIMSNDYFTGLLPHLSGLDWDINIRYEIKANLRTEQLAALARAGVRHIQPGIESLSSHVLTLMEKGVHATQNVQVLRDADDYGITVDWNMLYGFPGETEEDYATVLSQLGRLIHLQPAGITRILLERFSPYFQRPELGFAHRRPARQYHHVYDLDDSELFDLAYQFEGIPTGLAGDQEKALRHAMRIWQQHHPDSTLTQHETPHGLLIRDTRYGWPQRDLLIDDPATVTALRMLRTPRSTNALHQAIGAADNASPVLDFLRRNGLIFEEGGRLVALPTLTVPFRPARTAATHTGDAP
jgi:ribosomal peptide maturation radical SAM protein 1